MSIKRSKTNLPAANSAKKTSDNPGMFDAFTHQYPLTKTTQFQLIPVGNTEAKFIANCLVEKDRERFKKYKIVKTYVDGFHKHHIDNILSDMEVMGKLKGLARYAELYSVRNKTDEEKAEMAAFERTARSFIADAFKKNELYKKLFGKAMLTELLPDFLKGDEDATAVLDSFKGFTGYFDGLFQTRENIYTADDKACGIAHRCINDNLPKYLDNAIIYHTKLKDALPADVWEALGDECDNILGIAYVDYLFNPDQYVCFLSQKGIEGYNMMIGGYTNSDGSKVKGLNEYINLYNAKAEKRLPLLKPLYKQILSDRQSLSFIPEKFKSDEELLEALKNFFSEPFYGEKKFFDTCDVIIDLFSRLPDYDLNGIFFDEKSFSNMSKKIFGYWGALSVAWYDVYKASHPMGKKKAEAYDKEMKKAYKKAGSFSIAETDALAKQVEIEDDACTYTSVLDFLRVTAVEKVNNIKTAYEDCEALIEKGHTAKSSLASNKEATKNLKALVDALKDLQRFVRFLTGTGKEPVKDDVFYGKYTPVADSFQTITKLYDKVHNRLSGKPYSIDKLRMTFNIQNFLNGWVESKTDLSDAGTQYGGYLFRKLNDLGEYDYYIGFSENKKRFRFFTEVKNSDKSGFERLNYYQPKIDSIYGTCYLGENSYGADKNRMFDIFMRVAEENGKMEIYDFIASFREKQQSSPVGCSREIKYRDPELYQAILDDPAFQLQNRTIINNLVNTIKSMPRITNPGEILTKKYEMFFEVMDDIEALKAEKTYQYSAVSEIEMEQAMEDDVKPFYLYKISNKDLSFAENYLTGRRKNRGNDDLFTMFLKAVLSGTQSVYDLGSGTVFFREASLPGHVTHPANEPVKNKNKLNPKKESLFTYDLIKDKRYSVDQLSLHLSILMNYTRDNKKLADLNRDLQMAIAANPDQYVIGIDRGERNLIYVCVLNGRGEIVEQKSLNIITSDNGYTVDYHQLLRDRENLREKDKESWTPATQIKDLKSGYLGQAINEIVKLVLKYNAIIVMEDLNAGFKNNRKKIEISVYQQFEKALIEKLGYLVSSKNYDDAYKPGGLLNAYQLAKTDPKNKMFQNGIIFYVDPWDTSSIDPVTGFVDLIHPRYENDTQFVSFFSKFDSIVYNEDADWFEFTFDYSKFPYAGLSPVKKWTACTFGDRIQTSKKTELNNVTIHLTEELKALFAEYGIDYHHDLKNQILDKHVGKFQKTFTRLVGQTLQLRNTRPDYDSRDDDYILSPIRNADGTFFDSRNYKGDQFAALPGDADANGAYNIARKGMILVNRIKVEDPTITKEPGNDFENRSHKISLLVKREEYLRMAQSV